MPRRPASRRRPPSGTRRPRSPPAAGRESAGGGDGAAASSAGGTPKKRRRRSGGGPDAGEGSGRGGVAERTAEMLLRRKRELDSGKSHRSHVPALAIGELASLLEEPEERILQAAGASRRLSLLHLRREHPARSGEELWEYRVALSPSAFAAAT